MVSNYYTIRYLAADLRGRLAGDTITSLFTQERDELVLTFAREQRPLVISCAGDASTLFLHGGLARARTNARDLLSAAAGAQVTQVAHLPGDRVVVLTLSTGLQLTACLFGPHANVLLVDGAGEVVDRFLRRRTGRRAAASGMAQEPLPDGALLQEKAASSPLAISVLLRSAAPHLGLPLVREVLARAGVPPLLPAGELTPGALQEVQRSLLGLLQELEAPTPLLYEDPAGAPLLFSLVHLASLRGTVARPVTDVHEALRALLARRKAVRAVTAQKEVVLSALRRSQERDRRAFDAGTEDARRAERADAYEHWGKLLMAHLDSLHKGAESVQLGSGADAQTIALERSLTPVQNAQRYFEKAKRARAARTAAQARHRELARRVESAEQLITALEPIAGKEELRRFLREQAEALEAFGIGRKSEARARIPFRIFRVDGGFEVWAGKNSENNDLLTLRYARPRDLWFHARGAGGSHVVLRTGSASGVPGRKARAQAAGIAAYYSAMRHATMVPVAVTERRFVRKPKGAPAGTVTLEREDVLFAEPGLPEGTDA